MFENYFKNLTSLDGNEKIQHIIHHYWLSFLGTVIKVSLLPIILIIMLTLFGTDFWESVLDSLIFSLIALSTLVIWITFAIYHWYIWYFDVLILTDKRIVLLKQKRLFERSITSTSYEKIQDVTIRYKGIAQNIFRYGTVSIQTAGESPNLNIKNMNRPQKINHLITKLKDKNQRKDNS